MDLSLFKNLTLLYAEDDEETRELISRTFELFFGKVITTKDGLEAIEIFQKEVVDVIVLDVSMPQLDGISVAKEIRKENFNIPIFILTNNLETNTLLEATQLNLTNYIPKPITFEKIQNTLYKCIEQMQRTNNLKFYIENDLYYNFITKELSDISIHLTNKENQLLEILCKNEGKVLGKEYLEYTIFKEDIKENSLKHLIYSLRKKLQTKRILNLKEVGYIFR